MVNTTIFPTRRGALAPAASALNHERAPAYALSPQHQLAQLAATGCLGGTFYADAHAQLHATEQLALQVSTEFLARSALYARQAGHMKDMPALLAAVLAVRDVALLQRVFDRVIDNGKMLRNFVQILRSGVLGRKSLGTRPKKLVQQWLLQATEMQLLQAAIGQTPSLADVVKMVHPKPAQAWRSAWFAWLIGKPFEEAALPPLTQAFERFKRAVAAGEPAQPPEVPFQLLTAVPLTPEHWAQIARTGTWQMLRQNLNTFARQGVFGIDGMAQLIAAKLRDPEAIAGARVLPYQLMAACQAASAGVPSEVQLALQDALQMAMPNVPAVPGRVVLCVDVSASMLSPVTGQRGSATTAMRCVDVAGLMAAALLHHNPTARVMPFSSDVLAVALNPRDAVLTNAQHLARLCGGGTNCSAPLARLNAEGAQVDLVVYVSDNESWIDARPWLGTAFGLGPTATMQQWQRLKQRCPKARMVCIDTMPLSSAQAIERPDILNVGGFSDAVFATVTAFAQGRIDAQHWVGEIERMPLDTS
jgi:60 kDa SS-A/Ro ribonucleoprotein